MTEYSIGFSEKLVSAAQIVMDDSTQDSIDAQRTVLYISLLSCEIALKALLERAGKPVAEVKKCSHDFRKLLALFGECEVEEDIGNGFLKWVPAVRIRSITVDPTYGNATVGNLLEAENSGASTYPNEIRYGNSLKHYPPDLIVATACELVEWAKQHEGHIRLIHSDGQGRA